MEAGSARNHHRETPNMKAAALSLVFLAALAAGSPTPAEESPLEPGAKLEKLAGGFQFTEGPAADKEGNVFFTDQPNDRILEWSVDGKLSTFLQHGGRSNGLYFDRAGNLIACADEKNELWSTIDARRPGVAGSDPVVLIKDYQGKLLNGPNDLWIRPDGGIYFTDPFYKRDTGRGAPRSRTASTSTSSPAIARRSSE